MMNKQMNRPKQDEHRINERIRSRSVLIIKEDQKIGIMSPSRGMELAFEEGLDLVEVSPNSVPPVCKIMDYGKFKYKESKKLKNNTSPKHTLKEIRLRPNTDEHDIDTKLKAAKKFILAGHKVQLKMYFKKKREFALKDFAYVNMKNIVDKCKEFAKIENAPIMNGKILSCQLEPKLSNE